MQRYLLLASLPLVILIAADTQVTQPSSTNFLGSAETNSQQMIQQGRQIFRFDTFGDEAFWGDQLRLHETVNKLPPSAALQLGLKVDSDALPPAVVQAIKNGSVNLNDPAVTRLLVRLNAVLGVVGFFKPDGTLRSVGLTCAVCHSTVDDSLAPGIGHRIDGVANRDLNVGAIAASVPNLQPVVTRLKVQPGVN